MSHRNRELGGATPDSSSPVCRISFSWPPSASSNVVRKDTQLVYKNTLHFYFFIFYFFLSHNSIASWPLSEAASRTLPACSDTLLEPFSRVHCDVGRARAVATVRCGYACAGAIYWSIGFMVMVGVPVLQSSLIEALLNSREYTPLPAAVSAHMPAGSPKSLLRTGGNGYM
jgi:hypothetical protein